MRTMKTPANPTRDQLIDALATAFDRLIRAELSPSELTEALDLNRNEPNPEICHTHDYCDANLVMAQAFEQAMGRPIDLQSESDSVLWSAAWADWRRRDVVTNEERSNGPRR